MDMHGLAAAPQGGPSLYSEASAHRCGFCGGSSCMTTDSDKRRQYTCRNCAAVETITKGATSWWYHGWRHAAGAALRAPTSEEMRAGRYGWQPE